MRVTIHGEIIGYEILPDFGVFNIYTNPGIPQSIEEYRQHLGKCCL